MSENEKRLRDRYQKMRRGKIIIQMIMAGILVFATLLTLIPYILLSKNTYVNYEEDGKTDVRVFLEENSFYDKEYFGVEHAYIADLIKNIETDFKYALLMDAKAVNYKYSYSIDATVNVVDLDSKAPLYDPTFNLKEVKDAVASKKELCVAETVSIDYDHYNSIAQAYVDNYDIKNSSASLDVCMSVSVLGKSETFADDKNNIYTMNINIPLMRPTLKISTQTTVPTGEQKILACDSDIKNLLGILSIVFASLSVLMGIIIALYIIYTRDKHIDYSRKVQRLLSNYKSYIQRISSKFSFDDYKVLEVVTFEELLEIGDKLQHPVLMYENEDRTKSEFFVATSNGIIYLYVIKVSDDEIPVTYSVNNRRDFILKK